MTKTPPTRIVEIHVHRSKKHKKLGHAVAHLFPCDHHRYLGLTFYKGSDDSNMYRTQETRIIVFEYYEVMDKSACKLCPQDEFWVDDLVSREELDKLSELLETAEDI